MICYECASEADMRQMVGPDEKKELEEALARLDLPGHQYCRGCDCQHRVGEGNRIRLKTTSERITTE